MRISGFLYTPNNTGNPDYTVCGQASSVLNFTNASFKLSISQGSSPLTTLINTTDLSTLVAPIASTTTLDTLDINYTDFVYDAVTGKWVIVMNVYQIGNTVVKTWDKFFVHIEIAKTGYKTYTQVFEVYGYDLGNATIAPYTNTGNPDFNIYLISDTNNVVSGAQTKPFSSVISYRKPFTDEVHFYNGASTEGVITYYNDTTNVLIGTNSSGFISNTESLTVRKTSTIGSLTCSSTVIVTKKVWMPLLSISATSDESCDDCSNNLSPTTVSVIQDYSTVTPVNINGVLQFVSTYLTNTIELQQFDYTNVLIDTQVLAYSLTNYAAYILSPSTYLVPLVFTINTTELGDNIIQVCSLFKDYEPDPTFEVTQSENEYIITTIVSCCVDITISACSWWTVITGETCNDYIFKNCSSNSVDIEVQQLQDDNTFLTILTYTVAALSNQTLSFATDGIYLIKVTVVTEDVISYEYYSLPVYCEIQACFLYYLNQVICKQPNVVCNESDKVSYDFNAFIITFQTLMMLLNAELNYNYIYTSISADKLLELSTINDYIVRLKEYCTECETKCIPCNQ